MGCGCKKQNASPEQVKKLRIGSPALSPVWYLGTTRFSIKEVKID